MAIADLARITIEGGTARDYDALSAFHYRSGRPATVRSVWRAVRRGPTMIGRYACRSGRPGVLGIVVVSMPVLNCRARRTAWPGLLDAADRPTIAGRINTNVRTISRVIIDPRVRGVGLASRLVRHALDQADTRFTEAMATMGNACPFFERAGMQRIEYPRAPDDARLHRKLSRIGVDPMALLSGASCAKRIEALNAGDRRALLQAAHTWRLASGVRKRKTAHLADEPVRVLVRAARHLVFRPVYYAFDWDAPP